MLPDLRYQIERYADLYAQMVFNGESATMLASERYGRLCGLCYAYRELVYNDVRAIRGMANAEIEAANVRLGYIDAEGYAIEGAA